MGKISSVIENPDITQYANNHLKKLKLGLKSGIGPQKYVKFLNK